MKKLIYYLSIILISTNVNAQNLQFEGPASPTEPIEQYFEEENPTYERSLIYVFYNNDDCYACPQTIELIEQIYNQYYQNQYTFSIINYQDDDEYNFIETYDLSQPLSVVLVKVNDGATFGYEKLDNLQNQISDPTSFSEYFRYRVDSFLGNNG